MSNVYFAQPWGGLGDNLQFTTLPRLFHERGIDFYLSVQNTYRNPEIYDFVGKTILMLRVLLRMVQMLDL